MTKRLGRNDEDPDSRRWWAAAEKAAANRRKLVIPDAPNEKTDDRPVAKPEEPSASDSRKEET